MNNRNINLIIEQLEDELSDEQAYMGFYRFEEGEDENDSYVLANKQGVVRFAIRLLEAANSPKEEGEKYIQVDSEDVTKEGDYRVKYIKIYPEEGEGPNVEMQYKETWKDKAVKYGCFALLFLIVVCFFRGLISILKIVYNLIFHSF